MSSGAGRGLSDVIYVMVSSGIGAGLILGGRLHRGAAGFAGELGHMFVQDNGPVCRCGNRGCLETVASADALIRLLRPTHGNDLTLAKLLAAGRRRRPRRYQGRPGRRAGRSAALWPGSRNCLDPQAVIVGGDLSPAGEPLLSGISEAFDRYALPSAIRGVEIKAGILGARAEVLGALALVIGDTDRLHSAGLAALHGSTDMPVVA